ncbi:tail fiber assembly protein, partial [Escherichia coli]|nr:tail fiber assembly protein [Escherichia coli]
CGEDITFNQVAKFTVPLQIATEEEKALLAAWKTYRVLLNRVDTSTAPDIEWPAVPVME